MGVVVAMSGSCLDHLGRDYNAGEEESMDCSGAAMEPVIIRGGRSQILGLRHG